MSRLPFPGGDEGEWGDILNDFLQVSHSPNGVIKPDSITETQLTPGARSKLNATAPVSSVAGKTGAVTLVSSDVGLGNVTNTSDANKPVSNAVQAALDEKVDNNDFTAHETSTDPHASANYAIMLGGGRRIFVQPTDPGGAASDGDLWIDTA